MILFDESEAGGSSPSAFEFPSDIAEKMFKPCTIQKTLGNPACIVHIALEDMWGERGRWMASSDGRDLLAGVKRKLGRD